MISLFLCRCYGNRVVSWSGASLKIVDLTHIFGPDNLYWPGLPPFEFSNLSDGLNEKHGFWLV